MAPLFDILDGMIQRSFGCIFIGVFKYGNNWNAEGKELVFANTILISVFCKTDE